MNTIFSSVMFHQRHYGSWLMEVPIISSVFIRLNIYDFKFVFATNILAQEMLTLIEINFNFHA